jgi:Tfp pilus assembly protein PilV
MKKGIVIAVILICCGLYAMVKFSMSQTQNTNHQAEEPQNTEQINARNTDKATQAESSESAVPAAQVEAITKVYNEFRDALKNKDYEKAWEYTSQYFRERESNGMLMNFKEEMDAKGAVFAKAIIHPETAFKMDDLIGFLYTGPSFSSDLYLFFTKEDGQWKLYIGQEASDVRR